MRQYIATLHQRSDRHKKRFALVTAGSFTLLIFAIWALATFGEPVETTASANRAVEEANPFGSLIKGIGTGFGAIFNAAGEAKEGLETVKYQAETNSMNSYGQ